MTAEDIVELFPDELPALFRRIASPAFEAAILARDDTIAEKCDVINSLAAVVGRALALMMDGDEDGLRKLLPAMNETIVKMTTEAVDAIAEADRQRANSKENE